jgi:hypothetical protein
LNFNCDIVLFEASTTRTKRAANNPKLIYRGVVAWGGQHGPVGGAHKAWAVENSNKSVCNFVEPNRGPRPRRLQLFLHRMRRKRVAIAAVLRRKELTSSDELFQPDR